MNPKFMALVRVTHIYLTLFALLLLLFFAGTGFMLNHSEWFGLEETHTTTVHGSLAGPPADPPDKLGIVEQLRAKLGAVGALDSFETDQDPLRVVFKKPAVRTEVKIEKATGSYDAEIEAHGALAMLTELHRGQATGAPWKLLIDVTSISLILASLTGLVLWTSLPRRRRVGLTSLVIGIVLFVAAYLLLLP
jgi:hypothetical protein